jgi:CTP:molybdopterin cytidylyltransferase MocA/diadenosine tetraphosphate (Ap4A) HIT family hydrolase
MVASLTWRIVVLAAGKGKRMGSDRAKVLHRLEGETLLGHVLATASRLPIEKTAVVIGHQHEEVRREHEQWDVDFLLQEPQRGTGHAVQQAAEFLSGHEGCTLILYGDVPLLRRCTLLELIEEHVHAGNAVTVLTARVRQPAGYGRILRTADGELESIREDRDLTPEQHAIDEINSGIYAYRTSHLLEALRELDTDNEQGEYYLTDTIESLRGRGLRVGTYILADPLEISGINTPEQLAEAAAILAQRRGQGSEDCPVCELVGREGGAGYPILAVRPHAILAVSGTPYNSGQLVVHPKRHVLRHSDLEEDERKDLWDLGRLGGEILEEAYRPQGMNLGYTSPTPGQHLRLEVIPRWVGDTNFMPLVAGKTLLPEMLETTYERLKEVLAAREGKR